MRSVVTLLQVLIYLEDKGLSSQPVKYCGINSSCMEIGGTFASPLSKDR